MSTQIALYKLDAIRKSLVANRFNKKKADNLKTIGKLVYDAAVVKIPKSVMALKNLPLSIMTLSLENLAVKLSSSKQCLTFLGGRHIMFSIVLQH